MTLFKTPISCDILTYKYNTIILANRNAYRRTELFKQNRKISG